MIRESIAKLVEGSHLARGEMAGCMEEIMSGQATPAQIGSFITAMRIKGETVEEITGAAEVMRAKAVAVRPALPQGAVVVDTCGTGGDGMQTFNISTAAALVAAGAGAVVAKHGNKSVSSRCGSADVLEALGVKITVSPARVEECLSRTGIGFLFAPLLHGAMKYAIGPRKEIGVRTIFNVLGPLTNPAGAEVQVLGVFTPELTEVLAKVLRELGTRQAMVVHGSGLDEITTTGATKISHLKEGIINTYQVEPEDFGLARARLEDLLGGEAAENARIIRDILSGKSGPQRDITILNAAAALMVAERARDFHDGLEMAAAAIDRGDARRKLEELCAFSQGGA